MSETEEEQGDEPIHDMNFRLDVKQPEDPVRIDFVFPTKDLTLANKLKQ